MNKILSLQILRAAAAILVVWAHAIDLAVHRGLNAFQRDRAFLENFGAVGVDIFFVISGFIVSLTAARADGAGRFLAARAVRIWPTYALATLLVFLMDPAARASVSKLVLSLVFVQVPGNPSSMPTHPLGWSLMFEVVFYLMLAGAIRWDSRRPLTERVVIIVTGAVLFGSLLGFRQPLNIVGNPIAMEFLFGVLLGRVYQVRPVFPRWATTGMFVVGSVLLLSSAMYGFGAISEADRTLNASLSWERVRLWGVPAALLVASAVLRSETPSRLNRPLVFAGDASYSIYLFSFPALYLLGVHWNDWAPSSVDLAIVLATGIGVAAGIMCYLLIERPVTRYLRLRLLSVPHGNTLAAKISRQPAVGS